MEDDILSEAWPKEFAELKELEKLLRCNICKDFMKTSLITGCSHLFCSYCVRQSIQYRNQCPACFVELYDNQLRPERTLDEVIRIFTSVKRKLLKRLHISYAACPADDKEPKDPDSKDQVKAPAAPPPPITPALLFNSPLKSSTPLVTKPRTVPSMFSPKTIPQTKLFSSSGTKREPSNTSSDVTSGIKQDLPGEEKSRPTGLSGMLAGMSGTSGPSGIAQAGGKSVPCPVCSVEIPERNINLHLDECLARANGAPPKSLPQNKPTRTPLPKLVLSLMKDKELKQRCKDHGLSTIGDKKALITRIQRFTVLYNSECDSLNPRSRVDIIRQIEREEKSLMTSASERKPLFSEVGRKTDPKIIEEVHTKYLQDNKSAFQKLIENMKERNGTKIVRSPRPNANRILSDDEDDVKPVPSHCESSVSTGAKGTLSTMSTTINNKTDAKTPNSSFFNDKRKHAPPLSPEIQVAPHSPRPSTSPVSSPYVNHNISTSPPRFTPKSRVTIAHSPSPSKSSPESLFLPSSSPPNRLLFTPSPTPPGRNQGGVTTKVQASASNQSGVQSKPLASTSQSVLKSDTCASPQTLQVRRSESPDLFMADNMEEMDLFLTDIMMEEESGGENAREECASPDLLASNRSCSSRSSQITKDGHFVDSDSEEETNETVVKASYSSTSQNRAYSNTKSAVHSSHIKSSYQSKNKSLPNYHSNSNQSSRCYDDGESEPNSSHGNGIRASDSLIGGGNSDDDEDFLQLVQNKRGKRKTKELVFSPRTTRSKRMKP